MIKKIQEIYNRNIRDIVNFERCLKKKKKKEKEEGGGGKKCAFIEPMAYRQENFTFYYYR